MPGIFRQMFHKMAETTTNAGEIKQRSHYKRSLTKLALKAHCAFNLSEFPLRVAFARYAPSAQARRRAARKSDNLPPETLTQYAICTMVALRRLSDHNAESVLHQCPITTNQRPARRTTTARRSRYAGLPPRAQKVYCTSVPSW